MSLQMEIREASCRGCRLCVDICPTGVLEFNSETAKALLKETRDCIACLSCTYLCPSGAIRHSGYHQVRNFYRDLEFVQRMERFL